jgi:hypothetical protein
MITFFLLDVIFEKISFVTSSDHTPFSLVSFLEFVLKLCHYTMDMGD